MRSAAMLVALCLLPLASAGADPHAAKDPRNLTWVTEGVLALGGGGLDETQVDWLHEQGFRAIVDFREEHDDPAEHIASKGMQFLDFPVDSASHVNETRLATFVAWAKEQEAAGRPIYIHCTNGWHRAAAFAVAWRLATSDATFDEAARELVNARPGVVMRATSALLDYEAGLREQPQLAVVLVSPVTRPEPAGAMNASVDVFADGAPAAGASVRVWSEESKLRIEGVTDENGRFTFLYTAPKEGTFMDHVYARASLPGFADGADNIEFLFGEPARSRGPLDVTATRIEGEIVVEVASDGKPIASRVIATAPGWTAFESSPEGRVRFVDAPADAITVRAIAWGAEYGVAEVEALPPPEPVLEEPQVVEAEAPPVTETPPLAEEPAPPAPARWTDARLLAAGAAALAAVATAVGLFFRRRAPS